MNPEKAFNIADQAIFDSTGEHLNDLEKRIFIAACERQTYEEIADTNRYDAQHIKNEGNNLWKKLSSALGENVKKTNFKAALERRAKASRQSELVGIKVGIKVDNRYEIIKLLDKGEYGETYLAEDERLPDRSQRIIKRLRSESSRTMRHLQREAQVLSQLNNHPQILTLFDHLEEDGHFYLVQEFVEGYPLSAELHEGQPWSEAQVIPMVREILEILQFVHRYGVIHRDINPQNLIRRQIDNKLVLTNFGSVKRISTGQERSYAGSYGYQAPEQAMGRARLCSDIYAVGIVGIQALTGLSPNRLEGDGTHISWCNQVRVSSKLAAVLDRMVLSNYHQRYQSAEEVLQALQGL